MKKILALAFAFFLVLSAAGCSERYGSDNVEAPASTSEVAQENDIPASSDTAPVDDSVTEMEKTQIRRTLSSGVEVDASVSIPAAADFSSLAVYQGSLKKLNVEAVKDMLLGAEAETTEERQQVAETAFPDTEYVLWQTADGCFLCGTGDFITYATQQINDKMLYLYTEPAATEYNGGAFLTGADFPFASKEECFREIREVLAVLGIAVTDHYTCYSVDHNTLNAEEARIRAEIVERTRGAGVVNAGGSEMTEDEILYGMAKIDYTEEDDFYFFKIFPSAEGIPITRDSKGIAANGSYVAGSTIEAIYSREGILFLYINSVYECGGVLSESSGLDLEAAIDTLDQYYASLILDSEYKVESIELEYMPMSQGSKTDFKLVPVWRFLMLKTMHMPGKEDPNATVEVSDHDILFLDAITGQEIVRDMGGI